MLIDLVSCKNWSKAASKMPSSLLKKVFEVSLWERLIQDPSARRTKDSQPSGFGFEYCASHVRFRVFQQTARRPDTIPRHKSGKARIATGLCASIISHRKFASSR